MITRALLLLLAMMTGLTAAQAAEGTRAVDGRTQVAQLVQDCADKVAIAVQCRAQVMPLDGFSGLLPAPRLTAIRPVRPVQFSDRARE